MSHRIFILCFCFQNLVFYRVIASNMNLHCTRYTYNSFFPWTCNQFFSVFLLEYILEAFFSPHTKNLLCLAFCPSMRQLSFEKHYGFSCPWKSTPLPINSCKGVLLHPSFSLSGGWIFRYSPWLLLRKHTPFWQQLYHPILAPKGNVMQPVL